MGTQDDNSQRGIAAALQERVAGRSATELRHAQQELWKCRVRGKRGKAKAAFPLFPRPLGNLAEGARFPHSHSPAWPGWKSGKPKSGFPLFHAAPATMTAIYLSSAPKTKKGDRPLRGLFTLVFQDHSVLEPELDFRIILRLENAELGGV
jgi:hypothetical protein